MRQVDLIVNSLALAFVLDVDEMVGGKVGKRFRVQSLGGLRRGHNIYSIVYSRTQLQLFRPPYIAKCDMVYLHSLCLRRGVIRISSKGFLSKGEPSLRLLHGSSRMNGSHRNKSRCSPGLNRKCCRHRARVRD